MNGADTNAVYTAERQVFIDALTNTSAWTQALVSLDIRTSYSSIKVYGALPRGNSTTEETMDYVKSGAELSSYPYPSNASSFDGAYWLASPFTYGYAYSVEFAKWRELGRWLGIL